ncbi:hypothetical protein, partial [Xanthomonas vasicola]|uniref:hypothetical protein n=1 Tax=Xanthomonas vasicola TaxID=56459 RepID=UPI001D0CC651
ACNPGNTPQTCRNRQKIGDLSALSAADAVASFSGRVDQTIPKAPRRRAGQDQSSWLALLRAVSMRAV